MKYENTDENPLVHLWSSMKYENIEENSFVGSVYGTKTMQ